ncbi:MAG: hypothetical protein COA54_03335 [Thiotrichaceae bacterium]|nr:MAG: hypothetical protein COA54_03335 [Thiotrichaceae bacterium]
MTRASQVENRTKLKRSEKIFTGLGVTMVVVSSTIWILTEALAPNLTKPAWDIASPGLTLLTLLVGLYLVLRGTKRLINATVSRLDRSFEDFLLYRALRWILIKVLWALLLIVGFLLSCIGNAPTRRNNQTDSSNSPICDRGDGAWDVASDHYYDKDPPPPFS